MNDPFLEATNDPTDNDEDIIGVFSASSLKNAAYAAAYCLEELFSSEGELPEEITDSICSYDADLLDFAKKLAEQYKNLSSEEKDKLGHLTTYEDTPLEVAWPYTLVRAITLQTGISVDHDLKDPLTSHGYFDSDYFFQKEEDNPIPEENQVSQAQLEEELFESLADFLNVCSHIIGQHLNREDINLGLAYEAIELCMSTCNEENVDIKNLSFKTWFLECYDDVIICAADQDVDPAKGETVFDKYGILCH